MRGARAGISILVAAIWLAHSGVADARRDKGPKLVDVKAVKTVKPADGFVDDPFVINRAGNRLAYVVSDSGNLVKLHIANLSTGATVSSFDISKFAKIPKRIEYVMGGSHFFIVWQKEDGGKLFAGLVTSKGKLKRKFGPAKDLVLHTYKGKPVVVAYTAGRRKRVRRGPKFHHTVELRNLKTGRRVKKTSLYVDAGDKNAKMEFRLKFFAENYTFAVGIKGGGVDSKVDIRNPDVEGWYFMPTRKFTRSRPIRDLLKHKRRLIVKKKYQNKTKFMDVSSDQTKLRYWNGPKKYVVKLAQKFRHYDVKSLRYQIYNGQVFFTLKIDPTNDDAVARKVADAEYLDLYQYTPGRPAKRRGRLLLPGKRQHWWFASPNFWVVQPRHIGFDRGGKALRIYRLK